MITVTKAETPEDLDAVRGLVRAFMRWAMAEIAKSDNPTVFAGLEAELAELPGRYGPPSGCLALARLEGVPVGCVAFFGRPENTMEIKRMFVLPEARGHRIGGRMLDLLLTEARDMGHRRCLLWSHHTMQAAHAVYASAGFRQVPFSDEFPGATEGIDICMEMTL
jgi:GNAT superfamily N-acetyltransferase